MLAILSVIGQISVAEKRTPGVVPERFIKLSTPYFILSLATSLYSTAFISLRIMLFQREMNSLGINSQYKRRYSRVVEIVIESATLNSVNLIAFVVFTVRKSGNLDWPQDIQPQIAVRTFLPSHSPDSFSCRVSLLLSYSYEWHLDMLGLIQIGLRRVLALSEG